MARVVPTYTKPDKMLPLAADEIPKRKEKFSLTWKDLESVQSPREDRAEFSPALGTPSDSTMERENSATADTVSDLQAKASEKEIEISEIEIHTEYGGICYFVNLGLYLELYGDFTNPLQPGIDLPIWDFVALLAEQIVGVEVVEDPIWLLLAGLAGRTEGEPPGVHFDPPGHESLQAWLYELMLTVRPRLQSALGADEEELPRLFKQPARIVVTDTRFDAVFALDGLPVEIRLSGLDRNPGWVPAAGKFIGFHYE